MHCQPPYQACVPGAQRLLAACRKAGITVVHTMEAHKADLSDLHPAKLTRGNVPKGLRIGDAASMGRILIRDEPGNGIIDEVAPLEVSWPAISYLAGSSEIVRGGSTAIQDRGLLHQCKAAQFSHSMHFLLQRRERSCCTSRAKAHSTTQTWSPGCRLVASHTFLFVG